MPRCSGCYDTKFESTTKKCAAGEEVFCQTGQSVGACPTDKLDCRAVSPTPAPFVCDQAQNEVRCFGHGSGYHGYCVPSELRCVPKVVIDPKCPSGGTPSCRDGRTPIQCWGSPFFYCNDHTDKPTKTPTLAPTNYDRGPITCGTNEQLHCNGRPFFGKYYDCLAYGSAGGGGTGYLSCVGNSPTFAPTAVVCEKVGQTYIKNGTCTLPTDPIASDETFYCDTTVDTATKLRKHAAVCPSGKPACADPEKICVQQNGCVKQGKSLTAYKNVCPFYGTYDYDNKVAGICEDPIDCEGRYPTLMPTKAPTSHPTYDMAACVAPNFVPVCKNRALPYCDVDAQDCLAVYTKTCNITEGTHEYLCAETGKASVIYTTTCTADRRVGCEAIRTPSPTNAPSFPPTPFVDGGTAYPTAAPTSLTTRCNSTQQLLCTDPTGRVAGNPYCSPTNKRCIATVTCAGTEDEICPYGYSAPCSGTSLKSTDPSEGVEHSFALKAMGCRAKPTKAPTPAPGSPTAAPTAFPTSSPHSASHGGGGSSGGGLYNKTAGAPDCDVSSGKQILVCPGSKAWCEPYEQSCRDVITCTTEQLASRNYYELCTFGYSTYNYQHDLMNGDAHHYYNDLSGVRKDKYSDTDRLAATQCSSLTSSGGKTIPTHLKASLKSLHCMGYATPKPTPAPTSPAPTPYFSCNDYGGSGETKEYIAVCKNGRPYCQSFEKECKLVVRCTGTIKVYHEVNSTTLAPIGLGRVGQGTDTMQEICPYFNHSAYGSSSTGQWTCKQPIACVPWATRTPTRMPTSRPTSSCPAGHVTMCHPVNGRVSPVCDIAYQFCQPIVRCDNAIEGTNGTHVEVCPYNFLARGESSPKGICRDWQGTPTAPIGCIRNPKDTIPVFVPPTPSPTVYPTSSDRHPGAMHSHGGAAVDPGVKHDATPSPTPFDYTTCDMATHTVVCPGYAANCDDVQKECVKICDPADAAAATKMDGIARPNICCHKFGQVGYHDQCSIGRWDSTRTSTSFAGYNPDAPGCPVGAKKIGCEQNPTPQPTRQPSSAPTGTPTIKCDPATQWEVCCSSVADKHARRRLNSGGGTTYEGGGTTGGDPTPYPTTHPSKAPTVNNDARIDHGTGGSRCRVGTGCGAVDRCIEKVTGTAAGGRGSTGHGTSYEETAYDGKWVAGVWTTNPPTHAPTFVDITCDLTSNTRYCVDGRPFCEPDRQRCVPTKTCDASTEEEICAPVAGGRHCAAITLRDQPVGTATTTAKSYTLVAGKLCNGRAVYEYDGGSAGKEVLWNSALKDEWHVAKIADVSILADSGTVSSTFAEATAAGDYKCWSTGYTYAFDPQGASVHPESGDNLVGGEWLKYDGTAEAYVTQIVITNCVSKCSAGFGPTSCVAFNEVANTLAPTDAPTHLTDHENAKQLCGEGYELLCLDPSTGRTTDDPWCNNEHRYCHRIPTPAPTTPTMSPTADNPDFTDCTGDHQIKLCPNYQSRAEDCTDAEKGLTEATCLYTFSDCKGRHKCPYLLGEDCPASQWIECEYDTTKITGSISFAHLSEAALAPIEDLFIDALRTAIARRCSLPKSACSVVSMVYKPARRLTDFGDVPEGARRQLAEGEVANYEIEVSNYYQAQAASAAIQELSTDASARASLQIAIDEELESNGGVSAPEYTLDEASAPVTKEEFAPTSEPTDFPTERSNGGFVTAVTAEQCQARFSSHIRAEGDTITNGACENSTHTTACYYVQQQHNCLPVYECCVPKTASPTMLPTMAPTKDGATYIDEDGIPRVPTKAPTHEVCDLSGLTDPRGNACTGDYEPFCNNRPCTVFCDNDRTSKSCQMRGSGAAPAPCPSPINLPNAPPRWLVRGRVDVDTTTMPAAHNFESWVDSTFEDAIEKTVVDLLRLDLDSDVCAKAKKLYKVQVSWYQDKPGSPGVKEVDFTVQLWDEASADKVRDSLKSQGSSGGTAFTDVYGLANNLCPPMEGSADPVLFTKQCASSFSVEQQSVSMQQSTEETAQEQNNTTTSAAGGGAIAAVVILGLLLAVAVGGFLYYRRTQLAATSSREIGWLRNDSMSENAGSGAPLARLSSESSNTSTTNLQDLKLDRAYGDEDGFGDDDLKHEV
jgi:hypothetical protein